MLTILNTRKELQKFPPYLAEVTSGLGLGEIELANIRIGLDEVLTNCVLYAYGDGTGEISLDARVEDGALVFEVRDCGKPFNPLEGTLQMDSFDFSSDLPVGGLGIPLVKTIFSFLEYKRENEANILKLIYNLR